MTKLDWGNFDGPKRNPDWKPDLQDLVYTAINFRDDEYGDADDDAGQQIVERLLSALRAEQFDKELFNAHRHELLEKIASSNQIVAELEEDRDRLREFLGKVQGVCMGVAMSGRDHPNPDGALMELFKEAQALLFPPAPITTIGGDK